jgi:alpha-amylase
MRSLLFAICLVFTQAAFCQHAEVQVIVSKDTAIATENGFIRTTAMTTITKCYVHAERMPKWPWHGGNIYEVNVRQYTPEGTFNAFAKHLDRLKTMGVVALWFMPINPISHVDRKGSLGSYYAVADYTAVNPEFGTLADFKRLVVAAHDHGMKVLIDWVPNHSGADNRWLYEHPDFYVKDSTGKAAVPYDWTDTRQLNYANPVLRDSMIAAMKYWIVQADIDGFRCDVAWNVPGDFWQDCIAQLRRVKPIFMLAEGDKPYLPKSGFDAVYPWALFHKMVEVAKGERPAFSLDSVLHEYDTAYPDRTLELYFTSNHDENSSNGADYATFPGPAHAPFAVFTQTMPRGIPLIYSGQEEPVLRAIRFFDKDTIAFQAFGRATFYKTLLTLRRREPALDADAAFEKLPCGADSAVYAFVRAKAGKRVLVVLNFSRQSHAVNLPASVSGQALDVFADKIVSVGRSLNLQPWEYKVYEYSASQMGKRPSFPH